MTSLTRVATAVTLLLGLTGSPLRAAETDIPPRGPVPFEVLDSNADGYVDEQEFNRVHSERIQQRAAEGRMLRNAGNAPRFADIDSDGDGRLSREEYQAHQQQRRQSGYGRAPGASQ